mgnify:CR=1 FL=1
MLRSRREIVDEKGGRIAGVVGGFIFSAGMIWLGLAWMEDVVGVEASVVAALAVIAVATHVLWRMRGS